MAKEVYTTNYDEVPLIATSKMDHALSLIPMTLKTHRSEARFRKKSMYIH